jgi:hypothetical protein
MLKILELLTFEQLPNGKHEREFEIANRFVASQKSIFGREFILDEEYQERRKENEPPDCKAIEGDNRWGIELTEVVYQQYAGKNVRQKEYAQSIQSVISSKFRDLEGYYILIEDNYQNPPFPGLNKPKGQVIVNKIIKKLEDNLERVKALVHNELLIIDRTKEDADIGKVRLWIRKQTTSEKPIEIMFPYYFPILVDDLKGLLKSTIEKKAISRPDKRVKNMLLIHDVRTLVLPRDLPGNQVEFGLGFDEQVRMAQDALREYGAIFDEVWYFVPYKEYDKGHLVRILPSE